MYVALDISSSNIKILSLKGRQVNKWGSLTLEAGLVRDGLILQPQTVGEVVSALFKETGVPRESVIASLAGLSFTYRFLSLPRMKPSLLEEALLRTVRKEISLPLDELYLSWQALPGRSDEQAFFILGVPRNLVDALVQTLDAAGVRPYLMDLRPLALARAANRADAIIVDLEPDCFDIVFTAGGIPRVIHTISPRSEGATLEDNIRRLADELTKTAAFYQSSHPESQLSPATPLLLTGDLAAESPASGLLQAEVEYPVEPLVPPVELPPEFPVASYAAGIGLALKKTPQKAAGRGEDTRFHDININILSGKYRKTRRQPLSAGHILLVTFLVLAFVFIFPLYLARTNLGAENTGRQNELRNVSRELSLASLTAEETARTEDAVQKIIAATGAIKKANQSVTGIRGDFTSYVEAVTAALPPRTYFTAIDINRNQITARGETDSVFTVVSYATALETEGKFSEVRITQLDEGKSIISAAGETVEAPEGGVVITFEIVMNTQMPGY
jgi:hypothetical protein